MEPHFSIVEFAEIVRLLVLSDEEVHSFAGCPSDDPLQVEELQAGDQASLNVTQVNFFRPGDVAIANGTYEPQIVLLIVKDPFF